MSRLMLATLGIASVAAQSSFIYPVEVAASCTSSNEVFRINFDGQSTAIVLQGNPQLCVFGNGTTGAVDARDCSSPGSYAGTVFHYSASNGTFASGAAPGQCLTVTGSALRLSACDGGVNQTFKVDNSTATTHLQIGAECVRVDLSDPRPGPSPGPAPSPGGLANVVVDACPVDPAEPLPGQNWSAVAVEGGHLLKITVSGVEGCLGASGSFPGSHGPNLGVVPCNSTAASNLTWGSGPFGNTSQAVKLTLLHPLKCLGSFSESTCDCANGTHDPDGTLPPGANLELWQCEENPSTEYFARLGEMGLLQVNGLCVTAVSASVA